MESQTTRDRYGKDNDSFLKARRLVEAGVSVVTLATGGQHTLQLAARNEDLVRQVADIDAAARVLAGVHAYDAAVRLLDQVSEQVGAAPALAEGAVILGAGPASELETV